MRTRIRQRIRSRGETEILIVAQVDDPVQGEVSGLM